ncbi:hypothetical protein CRUP_015861 [Coryphaenoides rupestris]|nr:hypothetical protein CRUP_015861 [Coryphaenoides rupestris]
MEGDPITELSTPALVVDVDVVKRNAQRMISRCEALGVQLRPHMKTHKTLECGDIMTGGSRRCVVVSTLAEASFYADHGFDDILPSLRRRGLSLPVYVQQSLIGSCHAEDVAVRVLTRVIGHCPHRNQLLVDCGFAALSHDGGRKLPSGYAVIEGHPDLKLLSMSQEHGMVETITGELDYSKYPLGTLLTLVPYHSCATAMMHGVYHVHSGGRLVGKWFPTRGW